MKSIKKKGILKKLSKVGNDIQKIQHLASVLKKAGILTGFATFAGGIATGGVGIAIVTVGIAGLALSKLLNKKKDKHKLTNEQKEILTSILEKFMKDHANDSNVQNCEKIDDKLTDKEKEEIETILNLLKDDKNKSSNDEMDCDDDDDDDSKDKENKKEDDKENKKKDDNDKQKKDDKEELIDVIVTLLKNNEKQKK